MHRLCALPETVVLIVSGRPVREIRHLLGDLPLAILGSHGWESAVPGEDVVARTLAPAHAAALDTAEATARTLAGSAHTERKHASVAVHVRGLHPQASARLISALRVAWDAQIDDRALTIRPFSGGLELRIAGWDKGTAVTERLERDQPAFAAYLGDDDTDEDAFKAIGRWGVGIRVGAPAATAASGRLDQHQVPRFLEDWAEVIEGTRTP